jgi:hypothetical protein
MIEIDKMNKALRQLHDSRFIAIEDNLQKNSAKLTFLLEDQTLVYILLNEIVSLRCTDWKFENVILDMWIINDTIDNKRLLDLIIYVDELNKFQIENQAYASILEEIKNKTSFLVEINPSYGAYFVAIAKSIQITHLGSTT